MRLVIAVVFDDQMALMLNEKNKKEEDDVFGDLNDELGLAQKEVIEKHYAIYGRRLDITKLGREILPMLETVGLIRLEPDRNDGRRKLIYPIVPSPTSNETPINNNATDSGVNNIEAQPLLSDNH